VALGATPWNIQKIIFGQALRLAVIGLGLGLVVTLACSRVLEGFLFGVTSSDASTFTATALLLLLVVCVASVLPAFSATRAQPADVLRR
jgi:ABC-type antimicrobial peptide transport system permease subunit